MATDEPMAPGDEARPGEAPAGEMVCERCSGSGELDGNPCPECEGRGTVLKAIGGA